MLASAARPFSVYPRWRGEHRASCIVTTDRSGLSPLARGTHCQEWPLQARDRFIPAGAGNTRRRSAFSGVPAVYPRWRGEHALIRTHWQPFAGLSPLARGTRTAHICWFGSDRFIPAGAGNTRSSLSLQYSPTVYPRWRGEHVFTPSGDVVITGLSPLARGTHFHYVDNSVQTRFIPAGAGNTLNIYD